MKRLNRDHAALPTAADDERDAASAVRERKTLAHKPIRQKHTKESIALAEHSRRQAPQKPFCYSVRRNGGQDCD